MKHLPTFEVGEYLIDISNILHQIRKPGVTDVSEVDRAIQKVKELDQWLSEITEITYGGRK